MIRLRRRHWVYAFSMALLVHMASYLSLVSFPGGEPAWRGGGAFDQGGNLSPSSAGVLVQLGNPGESSGERKEQAALQEQSPAPKSREDQSQGFVASKEKPGVGAEESAIPPAEKTGPAPLKLPDATSSESKIVTAPVPKRKPKRRHLLPEIESPARRLPVQGPPQSSPEKTRKSAIDTTPSGQKATKSLAFVDRKGRVGTASSNTTGEIRELNYEDQVLLWLKRHGSYPYDAAVFRLEDTVTLEFAINRKGEILYHYLVKKSKYPLLNNAIDRMMKRASPVPPIPPEIAKNEIVFTIPVHFDPDLRS